MLEPIEQDDRRVQVNSKKGHCYQNIKLNSKKQYFKWTLEKHKYAD